MQTLEDRGRGTSKNFEEAFWCETFHLRFGSGRQKKPCRVRASNAGHCCIPASHHERGKSVANTSQPDFFTGWGVRTLASGEARYNPLSYHNGSVWPHDNAILASGIARYGFKIWRAKSCSVFWM